MPDLAPIPLAVAVLTCAACQNPAVVQWQRRSAQDPAHTVPVYSCGPHAITLDAAAHVHAATCSAPNPALSPACDCTPEPLPTPEPADIGTTTLSTGWVIPTPAA